MSASQRLAVNLRRLAAEVRERDGLTSAELLAKLLPGPTPSARTTWSRYLAGDHWPTAERLDWMAAVLGVDVADLLAEVKSG